MFLLVYVKVGETEKIDIIGNVDTINISRHVISVSLMLFSTTTHLKRTLVPLCVLVC